MSTDPSSILTAGVFAGAGLVVTAWHAYRGAPAWAGIFGVLSGMLLEGALVIAGHGPG